MERNRDKMNKIEHRESYFLFAQFVMYFAEFFLGLTGNELPKVDIGILLMLKKSGSLPISNIAHKMNIAKPNMTVVIDNLCNKALIHRCPSSVDRRVINIELTQKGLELIDKTLLEIDAAIEEVESVLSKEEQMELERAHKSLYTIGNKILDKFEIKNSK